MRNTRTTPCRRALPSGAIVLGVALLLGHPAFGQGTPGGRATPAQFRNDAGAALALDLAEAAVRPALSVGKEVTVVLARGQSAFFRLPDGAGDLIAATRRLAPDTDTVMALLDAQGRVLDEDDDGGDEGLSSRIEVAADQAGPLFLRVSGLEQAAGRFELLVEQAPARDPSGAPRSLAEAATRPELTVGQGFPVRLRTRQEAYFRLPAGRQDLMVLTRRLESGTDTVLALLDANGRELTEDDDGGEENLASRIEVPAGQRRPLFVRARALGATGAFEVVVLPDTTPPAPPFPRSLREAMAAPALAVGQSVPLLLRRSQSAFYRLPEGDIAVVTRNLRRGADTVLTLLDAGGQEIADDDDGGGGLASRLEVPATERRPLVVRASLLGDSTGAFDLAVEADAPAGPPLPQTVEQALAAPALARGVAVPIRLRRGQSAVFLLPPGEHVVQTQNLADGTDTVIAIIEESGAVVAEDDDGGGGLASRLNVGAARKGNLFLRAGVLGSGSGSFELILLPPGRR